MPFGVSVHASHAWSWYEPSQGGDRNEPKAGLPYDGKLTTADGKDKWWDGLDPQDLYEQRHMPAPDFRNGNSIHARWNWGNGITPPDQAFYNRTVDLINRANPDLLYFDDTALPLWPVSDAGLKTLPISTITTRPCVAENRQQFFSERFSPKIRGTRWCETSSEARRMRSSLFRGKPTPASGAGTIKRTSATRAQRW